MIEKIVLPPKRLEELGLKTGELRGLGSIVGLVGPNGGGKTRYLRLIAETANAAATPMRRAIENLQRTRKEMANRGSADREARHAVNEANATHEAALEKLRETATFRVSPPPLIIELKYPSNVEDILDARAAASQEIVSKIGKIDSDFSLPHRDSHYYCTHVARSLFNASHPLFEADEPVQRAGERARQFNALLREFLGFEIAFGVEQGEILPTAFGKRFLDTSKLSHGQKILLTWAILLHNKAYADQTLVVFVDEPETHLHPQACWDAIQRLRRLLGQEGQIWVATHSLPLAALMGNDSLYFAMDGALQPANRVPSKVWEGLLGGRGYRDQVVAFLDQDHIQAMSEFTTQSLLAAQVAHYTVSDPQGTQFTVSVSERLKSAHAVRVLDYCAGKGRMAQTLLQWASVELKGKASALTYWAYNSTSHTTDADRGSCQSAVAELRKFGAESHYTENLSDIAAVTSNHVDLVLLSNVLHEIPCVDWLSLFRSILDCCTKSAIVQIIEDQRPRLGELPTAQGFVILELNEWKALLDSNAVTEVRREHNGRDLTSFTFSVALLNQVGPERIRKALSMVARRALMAVVEMRQRATHSAADGRTHAFYAMLRLNSEIALQSFGGLMED